MWDQFEEFSGSIADVAQSIEQSSEDIRRATVYTQQQIAQSQADIANRRAGDSQLNWFQRTWFYASDQEKMFIILGIAGVVFAAWPTIQEAIK